MDISDKILASLKAPGQSDNASLERIDGGFVCTSTQENFPDIDGVPSFLSFCGNTSEKTTQNVKNFYEKHPLPNYEGQETFGDLIKKVRANAFAKSLQDGIGCNKLILECGCGTGQLSHFLQLNNNHVLGVDISISSLKLALQHKEQNGIARSSFAQMNIFSLAVKDNAFDVVISQGVLHHTHDARVAFAQLVPKVKPGGYIIIGLYNIITRIPTYIRSKLINILGPNIDPVVRHHISGEEKVISWVQDQYYNPHETWHSIDEVLGWFEENDIEYMNCYPAILETDGENKGLLSKTDRGSAYQRLISQFSWLFSISPEGALFTVIGRRKT